MRVLVACDLPDTSLDDLRTLGLEIDYQPQISPDQLPGAIRGAALLIAGRGRVTREAIAAGDALQMIVRRGVDIHNIDVDAASAEGVFVTHCPQAGAAAISELFLGNLLALDRQLLERADDLRSGRPQDEETISAMGLCGRTLGIVGQGPVLQQLASSARALGMRLLVWSPGLSSEAAADLGLDLCTHSGEVARGADAVAVYAPAERANELVLDHTFIDDLRPGALFVYVGTPGGLDAAALARAVRQRGVRAAIDVQTAGMQSEGVRFKADLLQLPGLIGTRFLWNRTRQAREATAMEVVQIVQRFLVAGDVINCVNLLERSAATWLLVLRLRDAPGVLAEILAAIRADGINAEEISNRVFHGARAAWCTVALDERPSSEALDAIAKLGGVLHWELRAMV